MVLGAAKWTAYNLTENDNGSHRVLRAVGWCEAVRHSRPAGRSYPAETGYGPMTPFTYNANPARVIFGFGTLEQLPAEVERLGLQRVLVVATPQQEADAHATASRLGARSAGVFAGAMMHTPVHVTGEAMKVVAERRVDGLVAVGGGSTTG